MTVVKIPTTGPWSVGYLLRNVCSDSPHADDVSHDSFLTSSHSLQRATKCQRLQSDCISPDSPSVLIQMHCGFPVGNQSTYGFNLW
jgi:hypothetical protein